MQPRFFRLAGLAVGLILLVWPASLAAGGNGANSLVGTGWRLNASDVPRQEFSVAAQIGPSHATGIYEFGYVTGLQLTGRVTCGDVDSGTAMIGGRITSTTDSAYEGAYFYVWFLDNGSHSFGSYGPDQVTFTDIGGGSSGLPTDVPANGTDFPADFPNHCPSAAGDSYDLMAGLGLLSILGEVSVH